MTISASHSGEVHGASGIEKEKTSWCGTAPCARIQRPVAMCQQVRQGDAETALAPYGDRDSCHIGPTVAKGWRSHKERLSDGAVNNRSLPFGDSIAPGRGDLKK